jgi:hypothetical protein
MSGREAGPRSAEQMGMPVTKLEAGKRSNMMRPFGKYIIRDSVSGAEEDPDDSDFEACPSLSLPCSKTPLADWVLPSSMPHLSLTFPPCAECLFSSPSSLNPLGHPSLSSPCSYPPQASVHLLLELHSSRRRNLYKIPSFSSSSSLGSKTKALQVQVQVLGLLHRAFSPFSVVLFEVARLYRKLEYTPLFSFVRRPGRPPPERSSRSSTITSPSQTLANERARRLAFGVCAFPSFFSTLTSTLSLFASCLCYSSSLLSHPMSATTLSIVCSTASTFSSKFFPFLVNRAGSRRVDPLG